MTFLKWRFDIDPEYQGWILIISSLVALNVFCLPCQCAGSSVSCIRRLANFVQQHLPLYLVCAAVFNAFLMYTIVAWMPDWNFKDYLTCVATALKYLASHAAKFVVSIAIIVAFVVVVTFKDRFMKIAGIDDKTLIRFKLRDVFGAGNTRPIELQILKVEELQNKNMFAPNNVFVQTNFGYNEPMKSRVHNNAGTYSTIKESLQMNFDDEEEDEALHIYVKNQKVVGAEELGRLELTPKDIQDLEKASSAKGKSGMWDPHTFIEKPLLPRGKIWLRIQQVVDEDHRGSMIC